MGSPVFHVDRRALVGEVVRVLRPGGIALFSTYSDRFWENRLHWFERQSAAGLIGEIDRMATHDGVIVCKDGFRAGTVHEDEFVHLSPTSMWSSSPLKLTTPASFSW